MKSGSVYQRKKKIENYIRKHGSASTNELSKIFSVSEMTIRRDLKEFEEEHVLERYHGGVRLCKDYTDNEMLYEQKGAQFSKEKAAIAKEVMKLLHEGDTIFLNSGSTSLSILHEINTKNEMIKVITNNALAPVAITNSQVDLMVTGGEYRKNSKSLVGDLATHIFSKVIANKCILSVNGVSVVHGVSTAVYQETLINELMVQHCKGDCIVVADGSKIGKFYNFRSVELDKIDILVTDSTADRKYVSEIENAGVRVIVAHVGKK
ncbi:DeoR/GlpR family DNA-binding transcription regulator [Bacillus sp. FJAT-50079]|uniref:DeoR/GlpR family DNA-binding transcription regulator n=1 Tax=Bacillus sp. FJAT-50079 TaxID=2833577 RepID=UPI001BCA1B4A|nr:DeoR/GlpR family DNA-binding transcription regulator [Bacillus sp. FJAT-50079]MBS4210174.1 DeoR/GlpR transcriptional regulator [Bacillus sp. FJAT-50079]